MLMLQNQKQKNTAAVPSFVGCFSGVTSDIISDLFFSF